MSAETIKNDTGLIKVLHRSETRGHANHGWLNARHTFSFARYFDEERVNFGVLRVLNDDIVAPSLGFDTHPHKNMEIITIPLEGALEHKDSNGNHGVIKSGDVQIMSAGSGIYHSEANASKSEKVNLLQIWVFPKEIDIEPRYDQKTYNLEERKNKFQVVVSPEKDSEAMWINQDAWFSLASLEKGKELDYTLHKKDNGIYLFVIEGSVEIEGLSLNRRDGLGLANFETTKLKASETTDVLIMEVPME